MAMQAERPVGAGTTLAPHDAAILATIGSATAGFCTLFGLVVLKALTYSCLTRSALVTSSPQRRRPPPTPRLLPRPPPRRLPHVAMDTPRIPIMCKPEGPRYAPWFLSDLPGDVIVYVIQLILAFYSLHGTALRGAPLAGETAFLSVESFLCMATTHIGYRLVMAFLGPGWQCAFNISALHNLVALVMYISILATHQCAVLGIVGMLAQFSLLFTSVGRVAVAYANPPGEGCRAAVSVIRVVAIATYSIVVPAVYLSVAVMEQDLLSVSYYSISLCIVSVCFFGISYLITLREAARRCCDSKPASYYANQMSIYGGVTPRDGGVTARDGGVTARDGGVTPRDGGVTARDGGVTARDGGVTSRDGDVTSEDVGMTAEDDSFTQKYDDKPPTYVDVTPKYDDKPPTYVDMTPKYDKPPTYVDMTPKYDDKPPTYVDVTPKYDDQLPIRDSVTSVGGDDVAAIHDPKLPIYDGKTFCLAHGKSTTIAATPSDEGSDAS